MHIQISKRPLTEASTKSQSLANVRHVEQLYSMKSSCQKPIVGESFTGIVKDLYTYEYRAFTIFVTEIVRLVQSTRSWGRGRWFPYLAPFQAPGDP